MKKQMTASILTVSALLLTACASNPTSTAAIQKENNQFEVTGVGKTNLIAKTMRLMLLIKPANAVQPSSSMRKPTITAYSKV